jgi:hypothetical protein
VVSTLEQADRISRPIAKSSLFKWVDVDILRKVVIILIVVYQSGTIGKIIYRLLYRLNFLYPGLVVAEFIR